MMHDIIKKDVGRNYHLISNSKRPIIYHPNSTVLNVSDNTVYKRCSDGFYTADDIALVEYIKNVRFATFDQIQRAFSDTNFTLDHLFDLVDDYILNVIVLGVREDREVFKNDEALFIFSTDIGGTYILNYSGINTNRWSLKDTHQSTRVIKRLLEQGEYYLRVLRHSDFKIRDFRSLRMFSVGRTVSEVDFSMSILKDSKIQNIIGYVVEDGYEDLYFRESIAALSDVFNETEAWRKDYPAFNQRPIVTLIVHSKESLVKVVNIIIHSTHYTEREINILLYDQVSNSDIEDWNAISYHVNEDGSVKFGKLKNHALH